MTKILTNIELTCGIILIYASVNEMITERLRLISIKGASVFVFALIGCILVDDYLDYRLKK